MAGVNDSLDDAAKLVRLLSPSGRLEVMVNLIPYTQNGLGLDAAVAHELGLGDKGRRLEQLGEGALRAFQRSLREEGVLCSVRATRGRDDCSACGMLVTAQ